MHSLHFEKYAKGMCESEDEMSLLTCTVEDDRSTVICVPKDLHKYY